MSIKHIIVVALCLMSVASAVTIKLSVLNGLTFPSPIGIDYQENTKKLILSVNYDTGGRPSNLEQLFQNGSFVGFSSLAGLTDELKIATVRSGPAVTQGGFTVGEVFTGNGAAGQVVRVSADGLTVQNPWVTLPGETGLIRGSLYSDRTGVWGGDLLVCTTKGGVWRITSAGVGTKIATITNNVHLEGLLAVPNLPRYGHYAGKILVGAEDQYGLHIISGPNSVQSFTNLPFAIEDLDIIEGNFYGVNYGTRKLLAAPATQFASVAGEILATMEFPTNTPNTPSRHGLAVLKWDSANNRPLFDGITLTSDSATVGQWEHVTFAPVGVLNIPDDDKPGCENKHFCTENTVSTTQSGNSACICFDPTPCPI